MMPLIDKVRRAGISTLRSAQELARKHDLLVLRNSESNYFHPHLARVLNRLHIKVVVDVGANDGRTVDELREMGFDGHIVSYEPTPALFARLHERFASDPSWSGHQVAVGSAAGTLPLNTYSADVFNSFLRPSRFGASRFRPLAGDVLETIDVPVVRLDDVWDIHVPAGRTLLKIDTQGFDLEVLRGAVACLSSIDAVLTEMPVNAIYEGAPAMSETFAFMERAGFELSGLFPVARDAQGLRLVEVNGVFFRRDVFA